jgi:hypothetical protein
MDFSRLDRNRVILGALGGSLLLLSLLFLPWFSLTDTAQRQQQNAWICGEGEFECTGWQTFPIMRWLLLAGAFAPLILAWILVRGHKLSWAPGEVTMVVGFAAITLIGYNGIIDRPAPDNGTEFGIGLSYGYGLALLGAIAIAATGFLRSQVGQKRERKAPGTV